MPLRRHFFLEVDVDEDGIAGSATDEEGRTQHFAGWLALIGALLGPPPLSNHAQGDLPGGADRLDH